jgi:hypothetical protein
VSLSLTLSRELVEPFVGGLVAGIDVDEGPTAEQLGVLQTIVDLLWERPDLEVRQVRKLSAEELAQFLVTEESRTMFHELHLTLEACRHPQSAEQVARVQEYADVLQVEGQDLAIFRALMTEGVHAAARDYQRFLDVNLAERVEPSLASTPIDPTHPEMQLAEKLLAFAEFGPGTLGRAYLDFYERFGLRLPGMDPSAINHFFVSHDMTHTIAGISTSVAGEIALSAFQFAMNNNRINRAALLASLVAHEAGFAHPRHLKGAETGVLNDPRAARLLAQELARGSVCRADFSLVDHFELAPMGLAEVRAEFGVARPANPGDGHHFQWA